MAERKFDIFEAMAAIDRRDSKWFEKQPDDAKKEFSAPVFVRWASALQNGKYSGDVLIAINDIVNVNMWDISTEHPELLYKLTAICGVGSKQRHEWLGMPTRKVSSNKARDLVARFNETLNDSEIDLIMKKHDRVSFLQFVDDTAIVPEEAKEIIKAYDKYYVIKEPKAKKSK